MKYLLGFRPNSSLHYVSAMAQLTIKLDFDSRDSKIFYEKNCSYLTTQFFWVYVGPNKDILGMALQYNIWKNLGIICNYYCCRLISNQTTKFLFPAKIATGTALIYAWGCRDGNILGCACSCPLVKERNLQNF